MLLAATLWALAIAQDIPALPAVPQDFWGQLLDKGGVGGLVAGMVGVLGFRIWDTNGKRLKRIESAVTRMDKRMMRMEMKLGLPVDVEDPLAGSKDEAA